MKKKGTAIRQIPEPKKYRIGGSTASGVERRRWMKTTRQAQTKPMLASLWLRAGEIDDCIKHAFLTYSQRGPRNVPIREYVKKACQNGTPRQTRRSRMKFPRFRWEQLVCAKRKFTTARPSRAIYDSKSAHPTRRVVAREGRRRGFSRTGKGREKSFWALFGRVCLW